MTSEKFSTSRGVLEERRKELKQMGKGNTPNKAETLTTDQVEQLWEKGELGNRDADSLQNTVFFYITQAFGFHGSHESREIRWGDVKRNNDRKDDYLELNERLSKTRTGSGGGGELVSLTLNYLRRGGESLPPKILQRVLKVKTGRNVP